MQQQEELANLRKLNSSSEIIEVQHTIHEEDKNKNKVPLTKGDEGSEGSEHGHQHGQSCKHSHNNANKKDKPKAKRTQKNLGIIFYCIFTCFSCLYLQVYCFHPLVQDESKRKLKSFFSILVCFMALWSYFQTIRTKNNLPKLKGVPNITDDGVTDSNFLIKQCQPCKYYKPPRVSHCSTCGGCIMKLDHHCIWTQNCIGYRNQKPFYLFTLYMSIGLYQFWTSTIITIGRMYGSCKFFSFFEPGVYILWLITCFSALVVGIMIIGLLISHTMMILTNHTTLMSMKLKRMCPLPFCQFRDMILEDQYINPFDRGEIQNIRNLFGTNLLLAFIPLTRQIQHDFLFQTSNPQPTKGQISNLTGGAQSQIKRDQQLKKTILRLKELYKDQKFKIEEQILQV